MNIYPRDLLTNLRTGLTKQVFVMMPFSSDLEQTFVTVGDACSELSIECIRADSLYGQKPILTHVVECIGNSQILVADLTGRNPNVFYEVGIAHATRRLESVILISQTLDDVPFDLRHLPILIYSPDEQLKLKLELKKRIEVSISMTDSLNTIRNVMYGAGFNARSVRNLIDLVASRLPSQILDIANFINDNSSNSEKFKKAYWQIIKIIDDSSDIEQKQLQVLAVSLLSSGYALREQRAFLEEQLQPVLTSRYSNDKIAYPPTIAQLCFTAIKNNFLKEESIEWLLNYLRNEKMGRIDVLRSQIEAWLIEDNDLDVEAALVSQLSSSLPSMREAASDILGMRRNPKTLQRINDALEVETDPYAARSMITAISRGGVTQYGDTIKKWTLSHRSLWETGPTSPTLPKTALNALKQLGFDKQSLQKFEDITLTQKS